MIRTLAWGFCRQTAEVVSALRTEKICDVVYWIGEKTPGVDSGIRPFFFGTFPNIPYKPCPPEIYDRVLEVLPSYIEMANRNNKFNQRTYHDYWNLFNRLVNYFYYLLTEHRIELVMFGSAPPHEGPDWLMYHLARAMGLQTLIPYQMLIPDRCMWCYELEDMGWFRNTPQLTPYEKMSIPQKHEKDVFYRQVPKKVYGPLQVLRDLARGRINAFWVVRNIRRYYRHLEELTDHAIDLTQKYVYYPLHLQPEMNTASIGGKYNDQLLALERLSSMLPKDWFIYIKENPNQTELMRGDWFFERLKAIPNLKMAPVGMSTYQLLNNCQFVATITGTVGWEAISGGRNVLAFGQPWYLTLPGVFYHTDDFDLQTLLNYRIDHAHLEEEFSRLLTKAGKGVLDEEYAQICPGYNEQENARKVAESLRILIENLPTAAGSN